VSIWITRSFFDFLLLIAPLTGLTDSGRRKNMSPGKAISLDLPGQSRAVAQKSLQRMINPKRDDSTMPYRLERPCKVFGCPNTTNNKNGYCDEHQAQVREWRGSARERGYDWHWERFRLRYLREHPLCVDCLAEHRMTPATEIHHVHKLRDYPQLKYTEENLKALCHQCHSKRTARGE
jgi:5-methylcytosine-specific restriction protein A